MKQLFEINKMISIVIGDFLDFDLGHKYLWTRGRLELWGSWNNWTVPTNCTVAVHRAHFYGYGLLTIPIGVHEYKWKFTAGVNSECDWFGDLSERPVVGCYQNQLLDTSATQLRTLQSIPFMFDEIANYETQPKFNDMLKHLGHELDIPNLIRTNCTTCQELLEIDYLTCLNGHGTHTDCYKSLWCPDCMSCYVEFFDIFPYSYYPIDLE